MISENLITSSASDAPRQAIAHFCRGAASNVTPPVTSMKKRILGLLTASALTLAFTGCQAGESIVTPAMIGHWEGTAHIVAAWIHHTSLSVKVDIHADGSVSGTVGNAKLTHGHFLRNRGWLFRKLNWATDYVIRGGLDGPIVAAEGIERSSVAIPLNFKDGMFEGGVNTSGTLWGGKKSQEFVAQHVKLVRSK